MYRRSQRHVDVVDYRERPSQSSANSNSNSNSNSGSSNSSDSGNTSSFSNDDRHKLFQAAGMTKDQELTLKVMKKIGLFKADNSPAEDFPQLLRITLSGQLETRTS